MQNTDENSSEEEKETTFNSTKRDEFSGPYIYQDFENEINIIDIIKTVWEKKIFISKVILMGVFIGVFIAYTTPKEFRSTSTLLPEYSTENSGSASSLLRQYGGLIGLRANTINSGSNALRVDLYPDIVTSTHFLLKLIQEPFNFSNLNTELTLLEYYTEVRKPDFLGIIKSYTIGLPSKIINVISTFFYTSEEKVVLAPIETDDSLVLNLSEEKIAVISILRQKIVASLDDKSGIVSVSVTLPDRVAAAEVTEYTIRKLTEYLKEYRIQKVIRDLEFVEQQLAIAETRFEAAQLELASYRDRNKGTITAIESTELQRLNSKYQISFNLYNSLTQQFEESKLKVQETTPVFKILEPVQVPLKDETSGMTILLNSILLSFIGSLGWIFSYPLINKLKAFLRD